MAVNHIFRDRTLSGGAVDTTALATTDQLETGRIAQLLELILIELRIMNLQTEDLENLRNDLSKEI